MRKHSLNPQKTFFSLPSAPSDCNGPVKAWSRPVGVPMHKPGTTDKNPLFLEKRVYQGSTGKVYPLPIIDAVSTGSQNRLWQAMPVKNEFICRMILPDIGGRIRIGLDKTNGCDFFDRQNVIKSALVGLAGPRASGSVEFNWPQHHRPATFMPVNRHIEKHPDGACTIWLNDLSWYGNIHVPTTYIENAALRIQKIGHYGQVGVAVNKPHHPVVNSMVRKGTIIHEYHANACPSDPIILKIPLPRRLDMRRLEVVLHDEHGEILLQQLPDATSWKRTKAPLPATIDYSAISLPALPLFNADLQVQQMQFALFLIDQMYAVQGKIRQAIQPCKKILLSDSARTLAAEFLVAAHGWKC